jgi:hypothetical protein
MRKTAISSLLALAACGGGGGDGGSPPPPAPPSQVTPEGVWLGSTNTGRSITGLVLDTGAYYFPYFAAGNSTAIAGFVQGTATASGTTFTSSDTRDFNLEGLGVLSGSIQGNFALRQSLSGTTNYGAQGTTTFSTSFSTDYDKVPALTTIAGTYTGQYALTSVAPIVEFATVTVTTGGTVTGSGLGGCSFSGTVSPRAKGNAYNVTLTFGASPCANAGQSFSGIGYYDDAPKRLGFLAPNSSRTLGVLFVGTKP